MSMRKCANPKGTHENANARCPQSVQRVITVGTSTTPTANANLLLEGERKREQGRVTPAHTTTRKDENSKREHKIICCYC